jgi:hypothetical protein
MLFGKILQHTLVTELLEEHPALSCPPIELFPLLRLRAVLGKSPRCRDFVSTDLLVTL